VVELKLLSVEHDNLASFHLAKVPFRCQSQTNLKCQLPLAVFLPVDCDVGDLGPSYRFLILQRRNFSRICAHSTSVPQLLKSYLSRNLTY
jgi:hypothetical protein